MQLWLWGSFFLVVLLFLRWSGSKWKKLNWLICTRKRWLKIWCYYGVARVIGFAIIFTIQKGYLDFFADNMGWPAQIVPYVLLPLEFSVPIIIVLLGGIVEAIIRVGFAAFAWWIYNWWAKIIRGLRTISNWEKLGMSLLAGAWLLGIANWLAFLKPYPPAELWTDLRGIPFAFYKTKNLGFVGSKSFFLWDSMIWNALIMVAFSLVLAAIWAWIARRNSDSSSDKCS